MENKLIRLKHEENDEISWLDPTKWRYPNYESLKKLNPLLLINLLLETVFTCMELCSESCQDKKGCWNDKFSPSGLNNVEIVLVKHFQLSGTFYCL